MLKKVIILILTLSLLAGCSDNNKNNTEKKSNIPSSIKQNTVTRTNDTVDLIKDEGALAKVMDELKNLDQFKGKNLTVYKLIAIHTGANGNKVKLEIRKDGTDEHILDEYEYKQGQWNGPKIVQVRNSSIINTNLAKLDSIDFSKVPTMYKNLKEKVKDIDGIRIEEHCYFYISDRNCFAGMRAVTPRAIYYAHFYLNGDIKRFSKL